MLKPAAVFAEVAVVFKEPSVFCEPLPFALQFQDTTRSLFVFNLESLPIWNPSESNDCSVFALLVVQSVAFDLK